jgi:hypothetical protein
MWIHDGSPHQSGNLQNWGLTVQGSLFFTPNALKLKGTVYGQMGSAWEWYHWMDTGQAFKMSSTAIDFVIYKFSFWIFQKTSKVYAASYKNASKCHVCKLQSPFLLSVYLVWMKKIRPWQDSNLQSPDPKSGALSIRPQGLRRYK